MTINLRPLGDKLLVQPIKKKERMIGSIIEAQTANAQLEEGTVLLISADQEPVFKVGEVVLYPTGAGVGEMRSGVWCRWLSTIEVWAINDEPETDPLHAA